MRGRTVCFSRTDAEPNSTHVFRNLQWERRRGFCRKTGTLASEMDLAPLAANCSGVVLSLHEASNQLEQKTRSHDKHASDRNRAFQFQFSCQIVASKQRTEGSPKE